SAITAGSGITFTGLNGLTIAGSGSLTANSGAIDITRAGNLTVGGASLTASTAINFNGGRGTPTTLKPFTATAPGVNVTGAPTVSIAGTVTANTALIGSATDFVAAGGKLVVPAVQLTAINSVGVAGNALLTKAATITAVGGLGGVFITEDDGASFTV